MDTLLYGWRTVNVFERFGTSPNQAGGWNHITTRGNERRAIFRSDPDLEHFLEVLEEMTRRFGVPLHAYVLMDNHYHLLLELTEPT